MSQSVLDIFKRSGDAHIGQTLLRLAALAETAHRFQTAQQIQKLSLSDAGLDAPAEPSAPEAQP